ncbi:metal ABC transporter permease [Brevibacillus dissolubilis]|uniref:metal ABC transporter permease n=1 Tax=Brevibacillus dissolubilis TaxID=1844116 RepID=UPI001115FCD6|nr:metal ABC transporter permease [Brevibacillus dissolubilis]
MTGWDVLQDPNTQWVLIGCMLLGMCSGMLGSFAFLRNRSLVGDALAHAALPGVCVMFLLTGAKSIGLFLIGAAVAGLLAIYSIQAITRYTRIKEDTALALTLSVFFGLGIVLLTFIQHSDSGNQSGLDKFLFGQAASLIASDVTAIVVVSGILLAATGLLFKEFKLLAFDPGFGRGLGYPMGLLDGLLMLMLLLTVVIGLQAVGVVLMAAMLIAPAVTARYWTDRLGLMVILSGLFGALSGALGTLFSTQIENLPTGPMIVLAATSFFLFSLLFSPRRGLLSRVIRFLRLRRKVLHEDVLQALYELHEQPHAQLTATSFTAEHLSQKTGKPRRRIQSALRALWRLGLLDGLESDTIRFTADGLVAAHQIVLNQRLWDIYHMNENQYQSAGIDKNLEEITPQLSPDTLAQMMKQLDDYDLTPTLLQKPKPAVSVPYTKKGGFSL